MWEVTDFFSALPLPTKEKNVTAINQFINKVFYDFAINFYIKYAFKAKKCVSVRLELFRNQSKFSIITKSPMQNQKFRSRDNLDELPTIFSFPGHSFIFTPSCLQVLQRVVVRTSLRR